MHKARYRWLGIVVLGCFSMSTAPADEPADFTSLFDGKTLNGWTSQSTDRFSVKDGVIFGDGGTGWLRSEKRYKNFELRAEFRALKPGADTGIFFRASSESTDKGPNWPSKCYQLQISDAENNLMIFGHGATVKFDRKPEALKAASKVVGEWQGLKLVVIGAKATVRLNETLITESDGIMVEDGHLGLQGENGQFEWRGIKIKELP